MQFSKPPEVNADFLSLRDFEGQVLAVHARGRKSFKTRFGEREAVKVTIVSTNQAPVNGWVFAAQFAAMEIGHWYAGELRRDGQRWVLLPIADRKQIKALQDRVTDLEKGVTDDDVPF